MRDNLSSVRVGPISTTSSVGIVPHPASVAQLDPRAESCITARRQFIELHKTSQPLGVVDWSQNCWDVTEALKNTLKGYKARKRARIHFTQHRAEEHRELGLRVGPAFPERDDLADVIKAFVCHRHVINAVTDLRHMVYIRAWRYLVAAMRSTDIAEVTPAVFNRAALAAAKEATSSRYTVHVALECIADTLDELHLVKVRLRWAWAKRKRGRSHGGSKQIKLHEGPEVDRRASDEVVLAIAQLYRIVPRTAWADRVCVLLATILVCTGLRLGQVLTLRAEMPLFDETNNEYYIRLVPFKRSEARRKTLLTATVDLLNDVFRELLEMTQPCRKVARWLAKNPGKVYLPQPDNMEGTIRAKKIQRWLGLENSQFDKRRREKWGITGDIVSLDALHERLKVHRFDRPVVPGTKNERLLLQECLSISFFEAMRRRGTALIYAVRPITEQNVSDCLRGRQKGSIPAQPNIFGRYGLTDAAGNSLSALSHGFRHKLTDALDKGGAPDLVQAQWFGRANPRDNKAYQYRTSSETREKARELLLQGQLHGRCADLLNQVAPSQRKAAAESLVQVAHATAGGYCIQNFAQVECDEFGQCHADCHSFHSAPTEAERKEELIDIRDDISRRLRIILDNMASDDAENDEYFASLQRQLRSVNDVLKSIEESEIGKQETA
ncbi:hypothetical protein LGM63_18445 [Burkholderia cepacia]|uniref:hypothetical protein n=1 Tax=Burkholderia cepacia TaxID=292 RepID=UPI001CF160F6|nr:hypothetical protein [Burkholderia cepacia]MCA7992633.1 hypothetical protein [Burkholderia cepacia]